jgi:tRNA nucleotidyltransferase (CCA-adding enzyme)
VNFLNYDNIINNIKPKPKEKALVHELIDKIILILQEAAHERNIPSKALLVGSVAKGTWLSGKADIDIFISFPMPQG